MTQRTQLCPIHYLCSFDSTHLDDFRDIVKGDHAHSAADGFDEMLARLAGVSINDIRLGDGEILCHFLNQLDLCTARAVKAAAHDGKSLDDDRIRVALHRIERLDAREEATPLVDLRDEKREEACESTCI